MLSYVLSFFWISLFFLSIHYCSFFKVDKVKVIWIHLAFAFKVLAALFMMWLYTSYYPNRQDADIYKYYDDGKIMADLFTEQPMKFVKIMTGNDGGTTAAEYLKNTKYWYGTPSISGINDNRLIISFNAMLSIISLNNIFTHMIFASFLAFIGLMYLFKFFSRISLRNNTLVFAATFFTPSLLFWTSGVLKESFMIFGLGGLLFYTMSHSDKMDLKKILSILVFTMVLFLSKMYIAILLLPLIAAYRWNQGFNDGKGILRYLAVNLLFLALILNLPYVSSLDPAVILSQKQYEFKCLAEWMNAGSVVYIPDLDGSWSSFLIATPYALFNSLVRPHFLDALNPLSLLALIEILIVIFLCILAIIFRTKEKDHIQNFTLFALNFIFLLALLIGWTSPVLGAIVRYRIPFILFMIVLPLFFFELEKIQIFTKPTKPNNEDN